MVLQLNRENGEDSTRDTWHDSWHDGRHLWLLQLPGGGLGGPQDDRSYLSWAKLLERVMEKNTSGNSCGLSDSIQQILLSELFSKIIQDVNCYFQYWNSPLLMICPRDPLVSLIPRTTGHEPIVLDQTWSNHLVGDIRCTKRIRSEA